MTKFLKSMIISLNSFKYSSVISQNHILNINTYMLLILRQSFLSVFILFKISQVSDHREFLSKEKIVTAGIGCTETSNQF